MRSGIKLEYKSTSLGQKKEFDRNFPNVRASKKQQKVGFPKIVGKF